MVDLSGSWLGTYWQQGNQTRFELTLIQCGNALNGSVLDDGHLGEATLSGEVVGRTIQFSKNYIKVKQVPVNYKGAVSEDGNSMSGTWDFFGKVGFELWETHREGENLTFKQKTYQQMGFQLTR